MDWKEGIDTMLIGFHDAQEMDTDLSFGQAKKRKENFTAVGCQARNEHESRWARRRVGNPSFLNGS